MAASGRIDDRCIVLGNAIHQPDPIQTWSDVPSGILNWESMVQEHTELTGAEIANGLKINCLLRLLPKDLAEQTLSQHGLTKVYNDVRAYVLDQISRRRGLGMLLPRHTPAKMSSSGPAPMELGSLSGEQATNEETYHDLEAMAFSKGKGKGSPPRNFGGQCYNCGMRGHRATECRNGPAKGSSAGKGGKALGKGSGPNWPYQTPPAAGQTKGGGKGTWTWQPGAHSFEHADSPGDAVGQQAKTLFSLTHAAVPVSNSFAALASLEDECVEDGHTGRTSTIPKPGGGSDTAHAPPVDAGNPNSSARVFDRSLGSKSGRALPGSRVSSDTPRIFPGSRFSSDTPCTVPNVVRPFRDLTVHCDPPLYSEVARARLKPNHRSVEHGVMPQSSMSLGYVGHDGCNANQVSRDILETPHWTAIESIVDSGAARSVCPLHFCDEFGTSKPTPGRDDHFKTATGARTPNEGHRVITAQGDDGQLLTTSYNVADVAQPLDSVSQMCDSGATVVFDKTGGWALGQDGHVLCAFLRRNDTYVRRAWVHRPAPKIPAESASNLPAPFARQG